jgi:hypothetical protein
LRSLTKRCTTNKLNPADCIAAPPVSFQAVSRPFNSLFKVLCNFPSRYLFAIGLVVIFSFAWSLPRFWAALSSNPTLRYTSYRQSLLSYGPCTRYGQWPRSRGLRKPDDAGKGYLNATILDGHRPQDSALSYSHFTRRYYGNPR